MEMSMQYRLKCDVHVFPPQLYLTVSHHTLNRPFLLHIFFMFATHVLYNFYMFFPIFSTFSLYMFFTHYFYTFLNCFQHIVFIISYTIFHIFYTVTYRAVLPLLYADPQDLSGQFLQGWSSPIGQLPESFVAWSVPNFFFRVSNVQNLKN